jgi:glyoxylase-like metal-dependent hydrolase (beta-lactamase superfamily II)
MEKGMKLTENLYAYVWQGNDNNCNSYLFANTLGNKHTLIDPGHIITPYLREPGYERLVKGIEKDGLKVADIGLIFITHAHPDHIEAAGKFKEASGAKIAIHREDEPAFKMFKAGKADVILEAGPLKIDSLVTENLEVIHTPGHSSGEVSLYWPAKKALAAGDVIFYRNTGRVDLPGGDPGLLRDSIERMSKLDVEYLLCGHPYQNPGVISGKNKVKENFDFLLNYMF